MSVRTSQEQFEQRNLLLVLGLWSLAKAEGFSSLLGKWTEAEISRS